LFPDVRLLRHACPVALRESGLGIDHGLRGPRAGPENRTRPVSRADEHVLGPRRTVDEVPGPQVPLLALDQQQAFAREDEEVLLHVLAVVHARRLTRVDDADVDAELSETVIALEGRVLAVVALVPLRVARVQHEPAVAAR